MHRLLKLMIVNKPIIFAVLLFVVVVSSCKDESGNPNTPLPIGCFFSEADKPDGTAWAARFQINGETQFRLLDSSEGTWARSAGLIDLLGIKIRVTEPTIFAGNVCRLPIIDVVMESPYGTGEVYYLRPNQPGASALVVKYLSDDAISGAAEFEVYTEYEENGTTITKVARLVISLEIGETCSPGGERPTTGSYKITVAASDTLRGTVTRWDENIAVVSFGPTVSGDQEHGMTMLLVKPVRQSADTCVITLASVQLTIVNNAVSPPDVRFYAFPTESKESTEINSYIGVRYYDDVLISGRGTIPMQREDAFGWQEKVSVTVEFDAFEVGYPTSPR